MTLPRVELWTDASYMRRQDAATYGVVLLEGNTCRELSGVLYEAKRIQRAELYAVVMGLQALEQSSFVFIYTDSAYVERGFRHLPYGVDVNLWRRVNKFKSKHKMICYHVRGHTGLPLNERAHDLARSALGMII